MADRIRLEVVTPEKEVFHAMVESFTIPAVEGRTGILYNHAPLLTVLEPGVLIYHKDNEAGRIAVSNGFMELHGNEAEILVASAEMAGDIDTARALADADRARKRLREKQEGLDYARAMAALNRAMARLQAVQYDPHDKKAQPDKQKEDRK